MIALGPIRMRRDRLPHLRIWKRKLKRRRHHADNARLASILHNIGSQHIWRAPEAALPQSVAEQSDGFPAPFLIHRENPPEYRFNSEQRKEVGWNARGTHPFGRPVIIPQKKSLPDEDCHVLKSAAAAFPIGEVEERNVALL